MRINNTFLNNDISLLSILCRNKKQKGNHKPHLDSIINRIDIKTNITLDSMSEKSECYDKDIYKLAKPGLAELEWFNFHCDGGVGNEGSIFKDGKEYLYKDFPEIELSWCQEIKADENNVINLENGSYYKYTAPDGKSYPMAVWNNSIGQPLIEMAKGKQNEGAMWYGTYWCCMCESPDIPDYFDISDDDERRFLEDAGIKPNSFFTLKIGDRTAEYFYSKSGNYGVCIRKEDYDMQYKSYTEGIGFRQAPVGTVIKIDGKDYTVDSSHHVDIPYGVDICNTGMTYFVGYNWREDPLTDQSYKDEYLL